MKQGLFGVGIIMDVNMAMAKSQMKGPKATLKIWDPGSVWMRRKVGTMKLGVFSTHFLQIQMSQPLMISCNPFFSKVPLVEFRK